MTVCAHTSEWRVKLSFIAYAKLTSFCGLLKTCSGEEVFLGVSDKLEEAIGRVYAVILVFVC